MKNTADTVARLRQLDDTVTRLEYITAILEWDQETNMPDGGAAERAAQIAMMSGMHHEKIIDEAWGEELSRMDEAGLGNLTGVDSAFVREIRKRWEKKVKVPVKLVEDLARETSLAQSAWVGARKADNFAAFAPHLETVLELEKAYAGIIAPDSDPYDALLDEYESGATGDEIALVFDGLATGLKSLMEKIDGGIRPGDDFLHRRYDTKSQDLFGRRIQQWMGYDTNRGRLDISVHPFTTSLGPDDVRVTTRYESENVLSGLFSNIHEAGHGLYDQGFGAAVRGSILGDGTSLGVHESQSRFWENTLGRSRAFWDRWYPEFSSLFSGNLNGVDVDAFYRAVNVIEPGLIRVDADEVTYSFHVIIRFRLERALISGDLAVADLPAAWKEAYRDLLGIDVPSDADGCLQDVHWSAGLFGYFPTYALGNLYAAQFTRAMEAELGSLDMHTSGDDASVILDWLRRNIHIHGRVYPPGELCRRVSGEDLNPSYFLEYLEAKYAGVYRF